MTDERPECLKAFLNALCGINFTAEITFTGQNNSTGQKLCDMKYMKYLLY